MPVEIDSQTGSTYKNGDCLRMSRNVITLLWDVQRHHIYVMSVRMCVCVCVLLYIALRSSPCARMGLRRRSKRQSGWEDREVGHEPAKSAACRADNMAAVRSALARSCMLH